MASLTTRNINISKLSHEMSGCPLRALSFPDGDVHIETEAVTQTALQDAVATHVYDPDWSLPPTEEELRPQRVREKMEAALVAIRNELVNWPADLSGNVSTSQLRDRLNQVMAQEKRNTQRLEKLCQLILSRYDVPEA